MKKTNRFLFTLLVGGILFGTTFYLDVILQSTIKPALLPIQDRMSKIVINAAPQSSSTKSECETCAEELTPGCTVVTISKGDQVFFGGNDDYINPDSYYWVDPGNENRYGAIWIGTPDNVQQGINEKGLAYDANGLPRVDTNPHPERQWVSFSYTYYPIQILHECATVEEVIAWVNTHRWHSYMHDQMHFADASGDAVIISAGADGELAFTRKPPGDSFLVSTNVNAANPSNGYPNENYDIASKVLSQLLDKEGDLTFQDVTGVMDAVHTEGGSSWTLETLLADLPNGVVYLYYFYQFDKPLVLNVAEELKNDRPSRPLSELFPEAVRQEAARRYQRALTSQGLCSPIGKAWVGLVLASLVLMIFLFIRKPKALLYWLPLTIVLGPLAVLVWLLAGRKQEARLWQSALLEAAGHIPPVAVSFMLMLVLILLSPEIQSNQLGQIAFIFILPLALGWLFYQGPLLAIAARRSYLRTLGQRFPATWVVSNLAMAGTFMLGLRLVNWITSTCSLVELTLWNMMSTWVAVVVGACLGMLIVLLYEVWAVHHGFRAWSVLALGTGEVSTPPWRKLWWWILLSYILLIGAIIVGR
jgi:hypothetical protein